MTPAEFILQRARAELAAGPLPPVVPRVPAWTHTPRAVLPVVASAAPSTTEPLARPPVSTTVPLPAPTPADGPRPTLPSTDSPLPSAPVPAIPPWPLAPPAAPRAAVPLWSADVPRETATGSAPWPLPVPPPRAPLPVDRVDTLPLPFAPVLREQLPEFGDRPTPPPSADDPPTIDTAVSDRIAVPTDELDPRLTSEETSLDPLAAAQADLLDQLRQRVDEHERLWQEQRALRRAALSR